MRLVREVDDLTRPPAVVHVDPWDGATGVFRDAPVAVRLSTPVDPRTLNPQTLWIQDDDGPVPGRLALCGDARLVVFEPARPLRADVWHFVVVSGLADPRGRRVLPHWSRFIACDVGREDIAF